MVRGMRTVLWSVATGAVIWGCASVTAGWDEDGAFIEFVGKDTEIIKAEGLEDAKDQVNEHLKTLMAQEPPNQEWIDDWKETYDGIVDAKKDDDDDRDAAKADTGKGGKSGKPV